MVTTSQQYPALPPDDPNRGLALAQPDEDTTLPHIGLVGDTYTITVTGEQTAGRFCVIDMHIPPGGGPPPHRHDFEETFILLEGEMEATFRGAETYSESRRHGDCTCECPAPVQERFLRTGSADLHLLTGRRGTVLYGSWRAGREPHHGTRKAERRTAGGIPEESQGLAPKYGTELLPEA